MAVVRTVGGPVAGFVDVEVDMDLSGSGRVSVRVNGDGSIDVRLPGRAPVVIVEDVFEVPAVRLDAELARLARDLS